MYKITVHFENGIYEAVDDVMNLTVNDVNRIWLEMESKSETVKIGTFNAQLEFTGFIMQKSQIGYLKIEQQEE